MTFILVNTKSGRIASAEMTYADAQLKAASLNAKLGNRLFVVKPAN